MRNTPQDLLDMINDPSFSMFDQWEAQALAMIQVKADCYLYSSLVQGDRSGLHAASSRKHRKDISRVDKKIRARR